MIRHDADVSIDQRVALDALALLSKKWHPVVVVVLIHHGPTGFNDLLEAIPGISGKVLSETLEALSDAGLVDRTIVNDSPLRVEYELTDAGRDMEEIFGALGTWGARHLESATPAILLADADRRITGMYSQWLTDRYTVSRAHDGDELEAALDETIDVLVYDEGLPGIDPQEISDLVESRCRTIALVGGRPDVTLLELDCDDVLRKPVVRETVLEVIDEQLNRQGEPPGRRERAALKAQLALLESVHPPERLEAADAYVEARRRLEALVPTLEE